MFCLFRRPNTHAQGIALIGLSGLKKKEWSWEGHMVVWVEFGWGGVDKYDQNICMYEILKE